MSTLWKVRVVSQPYKQRAPTFPKSPQHWIRIGTFAKTRTSRFLAESSTTQPSTAAIQLHEDGNVASESIQAVRLRVAPLVLDLCNQKDITKGLQGKFSVYHNAAVGLVRGKAGLQEYSDEAVNDPSIRIVRESVTAVGDPSITEDQAHIEVDLANGKTVSKFVLQSLGNIQRPLTNSQLEEKFRDQAMRVLPAHQVERLIELCWSIDDLSDVNTLLQTAIPGLGAGA